ncbi:hypothetical protein FGG08_007582, partial [Glutinoglossum americanum]
ENQPCKTGGMAPAHSFLPAPVMKPAGKHTVLPRLRLHQAAAKTHRQHFLAQEIVIRQLIPEIIPIDPAFQIFFPEQQTAATGKARRLPGGKQRQAGQQFNMDEHGIQPVLIPHYGRNDIGLGLQQGRRMREPGTDTTQFIRRHGDVRIAPPPQGLRSMWSQGSESVDFGIGVPSGFIGITGKNFYPEARIFLFPECRLIAPERLILRGATDQDFVPIQQLRRKTGDAVRITSSFRRAFERGQRFEQTDGFKGSCGHILRRKGRNQNSQQEEAQFKNHVNRPRYSLLRQNPPGGSLLPPVGLQRPAQGFLQRRPGLPFQFGPGLGTIKELDETRLLGRLPAEAGIFFQEAETQQAFAADGAGGDQRPGHLAPGAGKSGFGRKHVQKIGNQSARQVAAIRKIQSGAAGKSKVALQKITNNLAGGSFVFRTQRTGGIGNDNRKPFFSPTQGFMFGQPFGSLVGTSLRLRGWKGIFIGSSLGTGQDPGRTDVHHLRDTGFVGRLQDTPGALHIDFHQGLRVTAAEKIKSRRMINGGDPLHRGLDGAAVVQIAAEGADFFAEKVPGFFLIPDQYPDLRAALKQRANQITSYKTSCAHQLPPTSLTAPFKWNTDRFFFANETVWTYETPPTGEKSAVPKDEEAYTRRCFVMARAALQFRKFARFDASIADLDDQELARRVKQVASRPVWEAELAEDDRIVFPSSHNLLEFSQKHTAIVQKEIGAGWPTYFRPGNMAMPFPVSSDHQARTADELQKMIKSGQPAILWLTRFPSLAINHTVLVYAQSNTGTGIEFQVYDPNYTDTPKLLTYDTAKKTFSYQKTFYFKGGPVIARTVYWSPLQ